MSAVLFLLLIISLWTALLWVCLTDSTVCFPCTWMCNHVFREYTCKAEINFSPALGPKACCFPFSRLTSKKSSDSPAVCTLNVRPQLCFTVVFMPLSVTFSWQYFIGANMSETHTSNLNNVFLFLSLYVYVVHIFHTFLNCKLTQPHTMHKQYFTWLS